MAMTLTNVIKSNFLLIVAVAAAVAAAAETAADDDFPFKSDMFCLNDHIAMRSKLQFIANYRLCVTSNCPTNQTA